MSKLQHYIFALGVFCMMQSHVYAQNDTLSETESVSIETEAVQDSISTEVDAIIAKQLKFEENNTLLPYTIDTDTAFVPLKFAPKFKNKYKNDTDFTYEITERESTWQSIKRWLNDLLHDLFSGFDVDYDTKDNISLLFKIGGALVIVLVLYFLIRAHLQKELYWFIKRKGKNINTVIDEVERNLETVDFAKLVAQTEQDQQYRLAIRYYYLWLLQVLQKQNHIQWHIEKTNSDYVREIKDSRIREQFTYLSYVYNNIWYGEQVIDVQQFEKAKKSFTSTLTPTTHE